EGKTELAAIYLYPEQQGRGIGTALLDEGLHHIKGVKEVMVDVEKENEKGNTFCKARGYEVVDEFEENFAGSIVKTVRMGLKSEGEQPHPVRLSDSRHHIYHRYSSIAS